MVTYARAVMVLARERVVARVARERRREYGEGEAWVYVSGGVESRKARGLTDGIKETMT